MAYNNGYNGYNGYAGYSNQNPYPAAANPYDSRQQSFDTRPPPSYNQAAGVEMQSLTAHQAPAPEQERRDPNAILNDCRAISRAVDDLESRLEALQRLHRQFVSGAGVGVKEIDGLSADIMTGYRGLADRVRRIKGQREAQDPRNRPQVDSLDRRIRKAINHFQNVESQFRKDVQEQQRRQYLIVKPDASESEIREATESGADTQIFQQALLHSDRRGQAQSALQNVRQRHDAIQQIERTMLELAQLFQDLDRIVVEQEPMVQNIEAKAEETHTNLELGNIEVAKAVVSARGARKKKWICLGISILVLIIVIIIAVIVTKPWQK